MKYDNPAGRLLEILVKVKNHKKDESARAVWQSVLKLPTADLNPLLTAKLATIMLLPFQTLEMLAEEHPELTDPPPSWAMKVSQAFQVHNVHGAIDSFSSNINTDIIAEVKTIAVLLNKGSNRKTITVEELKKISEVINSTLQDVISSEQIDDGVRKYLVRSLRNILTAIEEYHLTGATPILEAVEKTVGHAMVDAKYKSFLKDSELGNRVLDALQAASCVVTIAVGLPALAQSAKNFIN